MSERPLPAPPSFFQRTLDRVEWAGNLLPHPASLFVILCAVMVVASWLLSIAGVSVEHTVTHQAIGVGQVGDARAGVCPDVHAAVFVVFHGRLDAVVDSLDFCRLAPGAGQPAVFSCASSRLPEP
jgi:hypothetical protein